MNNILFVAEHFRSYEVQWHQHECWELVYCTAGDGYFKFENGASIQYKVGDVVAIPPHERHTNISNQGFSNIHLTMENPVFPYRGAFRVSDEEGNLKHAIMQAKYYFLSDINKRELVLGALGELIVSFLRANADKRFTVTELMKQVEGLPAEITNQKLTGIFRLESVKPHYTRTMEKGRAYFQYKADETAEDVEDWEE